MTPSEWHQFVLSTPDPLQWDCFRFGIIQRADHFTFFSIVDHLHCDPTIISGLYTEILMNYRLLVTGGRARSVYRLRPATTISAGGRSNTCLL